MEKLYTDHLQHVMQRYAESMQHHNIDQLLIHSGSIEYQFLDDRALPFVVNPHFKYWVPITSVPDCAILFVPGQTPTLFYYKPVDFWHGTAPDPDGFWTSGWNIQEVNSLNDIVASIDAAKTTILTPSTSSFDTSAYAHVNPADFITELHFYRASKTGYEKECVRQANVLAAAAHQRAEMAFREGKSEYEINQAYLNCLGVNENGTPYQNIVALNQNGAILHYTTYTHDHFSEQERYAFLIDAGADFNGYAADITRTYAYRNDEFAEMIEYFDEKFLDLVDAIEIDAPYTDNQLRSHHLVAQALVDWEFITTTAEDAVANGITRHFYPHGVGHFIGLQVHDVGGHMKNPTGTQLSPPADHPYLRLTRTVSEGHLFTIEPGLYFIDPLLAELKSGDQTTKINWDKVDSFRKYGGIRIEDNIYIENGQKVNLTRPAFEASDAA